MKPTIATKLFVIAIALVTVATSACKSSDRNSGSRLAGLDLEMDRESESFAMLGNRKVQDAYAKAQGQLAQLREDFDLSDANRLASDLSDLRDLLEIFVHIFPLRTSEDRLLLFHAELSEGMRLLSDFSHLHDSAKILEARKPILAYAKGLSSSEAKAAFSSYLASVNTVYASRRTIPVMNGTCWAKVDFIPSLGSPAEQELHDFMNALIKATRFEAKEALKVIEVYDEEDNQSFQGARTKMKHLLMLARHFPELMDQDADLALKLGKIRELSTRYNAIDLLIDEREKLLSESKSSTLLDKRILKDWASCKSWQETKGNF